MDFADGQLTEITCSCGRKVFAVDILALQLGTNDTVNPGRGSCLSFYAIERCFADATGAINTPPICFHSPFFSDISYFVPEPFVKLVSTLGPWLHKGLHTVLMLVFRACLRPLGGEAFP